MHLPTALNLSELKSKFLCFFYTEHAEKVTELTEENSVSSVKTLGVLGVKILRVLYQIYISVQVIETLVRSTSLSPDQYRDEVWP